MSYLFAAYTVIWTLLFVFLVFIHRRQQEVQARLESLAHSREENSSEK